MKTFPKVLPFSHANAFSGPAVHPLLEQTREMMLAKSNQLFSTMFERVQDLLFNLADKAKDSQERIQYFDALRSVRLRRATIESHFSKELATALARAYNAKVDTNPASTETTNESVSRRATSDDELAELLTLSKMAERSRQLLRAELNAVGQQINAALKSNIVGDAGESLGPGVVCYAFRLAVNAVDPPLSSEVRRILLTVFERCVLRQLSAVYAALRDDVAEHQATSDPVIAASNSKRSMPPATTRRAVPYDLSQLLGVLHSLQQDGRTCANSYGYRSDWRENLKNYVTEKLSAQLSRPIALKEQDAKAIDTVRALIDQTLSNTPLAEPMHVLLTQLDIPIIKIALADAPFFASKSHPARRLLADLARAAANWKEPSDDTADSLHSQIQTIVAALRDEADVSITVFYELLETFDKFIAESGLAAETTQQTNHPTHYQLWTAIEGPIAKQTVPQPVLDFLRGPWHAVLTKIADENGCAGSAWNSGLRVVEQLLWSIAPKRSAGERKLFAVLIPRLLNDINKGLAVIGWDHKQQTHFHAELQTLHLAALRPTHATQQTLLVHSQSIVRANDQTAEITLFSAQNTMHVDAVPQSENNAMEPLQFANALPLGTWLDLTDDDFREKRAKLAWKDENLHTFTFVNRRFQVVADLHLHDLASKLADGKARLVEDVPLVDRALDALARKFMTR